MDRLEVLAPVVVGDLASLASTHAMAEQAIARGPFEVIVHNAGWFPSGDVRPVTADGMEQTFQVNVVAPYLLGVLLPRPRRLVVVGSDSVRGAHLDLTDLQGERSWDAGRAYSSSKIAVTALSFAVARRWPDVVVTVVHPGWVRTKMSGDEAPLSVEEGADTVVWLAEGKEQAARRSGVLYSQRRPVSYNDEVDDPAVHEAVLEAVQRLSGEPLS